MKRRALIALTAAALFGYCAGAGADADGPDRWRVSGVAADSRLNVRRGPSTQFATVGSLPAGATRLENLGCFPQFNAAEWQRFSRAERRLATAMRWCRIRHGDVSGWVSARFLTEY